MSYVDELIATENDAYDNLYDIIFTFPGTLKGEVISPTASMKIRSQDIKIPEPTLESYKISYKTVEIEKPKPKIKLEKKLSIDFRVDAYYDIYNILKKWENLSFDANGKFIPLKNGLNNYGKIEVIAYATAESGAVANDTSLVSKRWIFENVWFAGFETGPQFKREGGDAIKITAPFYFMKKEEV